MTLITQLSVGMPHVSVIDLFASLPILFSVAFILSHLKAIMFHKFKTQSDLPLSLFYICACIVYLRFPVGCLSELNLWPKQSCVSLF